jgi:hypothetical protein
MTIMQYNIISKSLVSDKIYKSGISILDFPLCYISCFLPQKPDWNKSTNFSGQPIIKQLLKLLPFDIISPTVKQHNSDKYYKRFKTYHHLVTMIHATLSGVSSLRTIYNIACL